MGFRDLGLRDLGRSELWTRFRALFQKIWDLVFAAWERRRSLEV